jgi:AAA domain
VVGLVLEHARRQPGMSLGVIALGIRHAERIDEMLRAALAGHPGLEAFFAEDRPEPFFVKNLERVQGDERDSIILSIGYGKHRDGRMRYHWGPLLRNGGERRLNVAVTRARQRLTLVSSFSSRDVDPDRVTSAGARLLCDYLEYTDSGGAAAGEPAPQHTGLGPFEADVAERLAELGITVVPRYGVGGYRVDLPRPIRPSPAAWCWRSRRTGRPTATRAQRVTGTGCARSTWNASAGPSTASGRPTGSATRPSRRPGLSRPTARRWRQPSRRPGRTARLGITKARPNRARPPPTARPPTARRPAARPLTARPLTARSPAARSPTAQPATALAGVGRVRPSPSGNRPARSAGPHPAEESRPRMNRRA